MADEAKATATGTTEAQTEAKTEAKTETQETQNTGLTKEAVEKLIQSSVDSRTADLGKTIAALKKENESLKKEKMNADELKEYELTEREKALAAKDKEIADKANRLYAVQKAAAEGLDLGKNLEYLDCIIGDSEDVIDGKVKAIKAWIDAAVNAKVSETFKSNGRNPNGGNQNGTDEKSGGGIAEKLGKARAEQQKKSNEILNHYLGGKKR